MIARVLLAIDDSPASLAAVRFAVELATACGATLRAVTVVADHAVTELFGGSADEAVHARRRHSAGSVLGHAAAAGRRRCVAVETALLEGEPAPRILQEARQWPADLIVMGRDGVPRAGEHYLGGQTRHVVEFAGVPVLVVPKDRR